MVTGAGGIPLNESLLAPLDVARFVVAYLVLALIPGYALATLARPRSPRIERVALAIPCAYGLVAVCGLATALLRLPFDVVTYGVVALPAVVAGCYNLCRGRGASPREALRGVRWWHLAPIGVAAAQVSASAIVFARDVVPPDVDAVSHVVWTDLIARTHAYPIALLSSHAGATDGGFYPPAFHALTALILNIAPMATYRAIFYSAMAAVVLLPVALFCYVRTATDSPRLGALAALAALAFVPLPFSALTTGLFPFLTSFLSVPALALTLRDGLGRGDRRSVALAALLGIGLFYTHPTEFVTVALLALAVMPALPRDRRAWLRTGGYGAIIASICGCAAAPALAAVHRTIAGNAQSEIRAEHLFIQARQIHLSSVAGSYLSGGFGLYMSYALLGATIIGIAWCLVRRRLLGLVTAQAILSAVYVDAHSFNLLQRFYDIAFPWALSDRLLPTHYWFTLPLAAIGIDVTARGVRRCVSGRGRLPAVSAVAAIWCAGLGLALPLYMAIVLSTVYNGATTVVGPEDMRALTWLAHHSPPNALAMTDANFVHRDYLNGPIDAGLWMAAVGGPASLFGHGGESLGSVAERLYLLRHIADSPVPPRVARFAVRHHVRYVFYGSRIRTGATRDMSLTRLFAAPSLRLVYSGAAACRPTGPHLPSLCPPTGAYLFAFDTHTTTVRRGQIALNSHVPRPAQHLSS